MSSQLRELYTNCDILTIESARIWNVPVTTDNMREDAQATNLFRRLFFFLKICSLMFGIREHPQTTSAAQQATQGIDPGFCNFWIFHNNHDNRDCENHQSHQATEHQLHHCQLQNRKCPDLE